MPATAHATVIGVSESILGTETLLGCTAEAARGRADGGPFARITGKGADNRAARRADQTADARAHRSFPSGAAG